MIPACKRPLILLLVLAFLLTTTPQAKANVAGASDAKATGVILALVGAGAVIGIAIYYAAHHGDSLKGCATAGPGGLLLLNEGDQQNYALSGSVDEVRAGERVRLLGKKRKGSTSPRQFVVTGIKKDYGPCSVQPSH